ADATSVGAVTGAWVLHDVSNPGGFGDGSEYQLSVSANTAAGFAGTSGQPYNVVGMSFKTTGGALTVNGTFTASSSTVNFGGTSAVNIPALTYNNVAFIP